MGPFWVVSSHVSARNQNQVFCKNGNLAAEPPPYPHFYYFKWCGGEQGMHMWECRFLQRPEASNPSEAGVTGGCEQPLHGCWPPQLGLLKEQYILTTTEPTKPLQTQHLLFSTAKLESPHWLRTLEKRFFTNPFCQSPLIRIWLTGPQKTGFTLSSCQDRKGRAQMRFSGLQSSGGKVIL